MSRKPLGERPMTDAERQARYRAARAAARPVIRFRRPADHRSRAKRWRETVDELVQLQAEYQACQRRSNSRQIGRLKIRHFDPLRA